MKFKVLSIQEVLLDLTSSETTGLMNQT